jgi:hypothetical protein
MTTKLPISFHPSATDEDIVEAIASYMREARAAAVPGAWRIIVARLREAYGGKLVDAAVHRYARELRQEQRLASAPSAASAGGVEKVRGAKPVAV